MFKSYFKIAFRNFTKNKGFSFINIFGLSIGLTSCMLITLYILNELDYDSFQKNKDRIARVIMEYRFDGSTQSNKGNFTSVRVASVFKKTFPEVEAAVIVARYSRIVHNNENLIDEKNFYFADSNFFKIFSFHLIKGNPQGVLAAPYDMVLTRTTAKRYFGNQNPVGKMMNIGNDHLYRITGVAEDCPPNSQIKFDFIASFSSLGLGKEYEETYWDANYTTFLLLKEPTSRESLQAKLPAFMKREMAGQGAYINFWLEPFADIHLHSEFTGFEPNNNIVNIYLLAGLALLILIIACSTFINLSTAQSLERAKEVGVRKVIGAGRRQLFWQFMLESGVICFISLTCSFVLAAIAIPYYNLLTDKHLTLLSLFSFSFIFSSLIIAGLVTLFAGSYPAMILSGFQPIKVLKGSFKHQGSGQRLRSSLIVFQFAISVFMIVSSMIFKKQLLYIQNKNLGYDRSRILVLPIDNSFYSRIPLMKVALKSDPEIVSVASCVRTPVEGGGGYSMRSSLMPHNQQIAVIANPVDEDFINTTGISLIAGGNLTARDILDASDTNQNKRSYHFILNQSAAAELGWTPDQAIGKKMFLGDERPGVIRGVVRDFNFESLHHPIQAIILFPEPRVNNILLKLRGHNLPKTIAFVESQWKNLFPDRPFEYHFLDEDFNKLYESELRLGRMVNLSSAIAITLACLGLFGLSSYSIKQRLKEISVRKVLGASVRNIIFLLAGIFIRLAVISLLIAFPLGWWMMNTWLNGFAYRTSLGVDTFLKAGIITLLITLITISFQSVKAAVAKPAGNLKSE